MLMHIIQASWAEYWTHCGLEFLNDKHSYYATEKHHHILTDGSLGVFSYFYVNYYSSRHDWCEACEQKSRQVGDVPAEETESYKSLKKKMKWL